jgi:hypothetical protein
MRWVRRRCALRGPRSPGRTGQVRVAGERRAAVPGQLDLGHDRDEARRSVLDHLAHLRAR